MEQYGFWAYGRYAQIEPWVYRNGGRLLNPEGTRLDPTPEAIEALRFVTDPTREHGVAPTPAEMEGIRQQDGLGRHRRQAAAVVPMAVRPVAGDHRSFQRGGAHPAQKLVDLPGPKGR